MNGEVLGGIIRHILTALGGVLVTKGMIDAGQLEIAAGAVATLAGLVWSVWQKKK